MSEAAAPRRVGIGALLSDDRLAKRAMTGDQRAFAAIYRRYDQSLYRYCLAIVGNPQDAQDALQNTMVKVLRSLPGEERRLELKPWLYRIAHNESIELLRRRRGAVQLDPEAAAQGLGTADEAAARERLRYLVADLKELPERQRGALVMRELGGLEFAEIGAALGTSAAVARQTLYEARLGLREMDAGREMTCQTVTRVLSDGDGRVVRRRDIRAHLRDCSNCRRFRDEIAARQRDLAMLSPLPAAAAAGLLQGVLGGSGGSAGGGLATALGAGAAKSAGAPIALKSAAAVVAVAVVGVTAADRGCLIDLGPDHHDGSQPAQSQSAPAEEASKAAASQPGEATVAQPRSHSAARGGSGQSHSGTPNADVGTRRNPNSTNAAAAPPAPESSPAAHPHGRGHAKELPPASAHGQETAAAHKAINAERHAKSPPTHPAHPTHPAKPSPTHEPSPSSAGEHKTQPGSGKASTPPESEATAPPETGKKKP